MQNEFFEDAGENVAVMDAAEVPANESAEPAAVPGLETMAVDVPAQTEAKYNPVMPATGDTGQPWNPTTQLGDDLDIATKLRRQTAAVRLQVAKLGTNKALSFQQRETAAVPFAADPDSLSARKRLLNTKDAAYREVVGCINHAKALWRSFTIPYPEKGIRLLRKDRVEEFSARMDEIKARLETAVVALEAVYPQLREAAKESLGNLYDAMDYPGSIAGRFAIEYDWPNVDPPEYLKQINPALYQEQIEKMQGRFAEAIRLTEEGLTVELQKLIEHLCDRLTPDADGKPKMIRESAVENINEFFKKFGEIGLGQTGALKDLVEQAKAVVANQNIDTLRKDVTARQALAEAMAGVKQQIDAVVQAKPSRHIEFEDAE